MHASDIGWEGGYLLKKKKKASSVHLFPQLSLPVTRVPEKQRLVVGALLQLAEVGLLAKLTRDWLPTYPERWERRTEIQSGQHEAGCTSLLQNLHQLVHQPCHYNPRKTQVKSAFALLAAGMLLAVFVFALEVVVSLCPRRAAKPRGRRRQASSRPPPPSPPPPPPPPPSVRHQAVQTD